MGGDATQIVHENATLSVASPAPDSVLPSPQATKDSPSSSSVQSPATRPLFNSQEGRIAAYKRMIQKDTFPYARANIEALIRYYEDGGRIPQGDEEVWVIDGEVSFGIRKYTSFEKMPEGWLTKNKFLDVSGPYLLLILLWVLTFVLLCPRC